jgi:hypothetical protein
MALPSTPVRGYSFTDHSTTQPNVPQPGNQLDAEHDRTNNAVASLIAFVQVALAADGTLKGHSVTADALHPDVYTTIQLAVENTTIPLAVQEARDWAEKLDGPVDDGFYSARFWALQADTQISALVPIVTALEGFLESGTPQQVLDAAAQVALDAQTATTAATSATAANTSVQALVQAIEEDFAISIVFDFGFIGGPVGVPEDWGTL